MIECKCKCISGPNCECHYCEHYKECYSWMEEKAIANAKEITKSSYIEEPKNNVNIADTVNHPAHYNAGKYEVIDVIEDWELDFCLGNAIKYIARAGKKDKNKTVEDLEKAIWYINRYIKKTI